MKKLCRPASAGSFAEAMKRAKEFETAQDIVDIINDADSYFKSHPITIDRLTIEYYCFDSRVDWDTWLICLDSKVSLFTNCNVEGIKRVLNYKG